MEQNRYTIDDDYIFNKDGSFSGKVIRRKGPHRLLLKDDKGGGRYYEFADQVEDPKNIVKTYKKNRGEQVKAIPFSRSDVFNTMDYRGAFQEDNVTPTGFYKNSRGGERFDYTYSRLLPEYVEDAKGRVAPDSTFFLPEGDGYAHNTYNFGNFLWAATGRAAGYPTKLLQAGAHGNSLINSEYNSYESQLDSPDDQLSIKRGANYVDKNREFLRKHYPIKNAFGKYKELAKPYSKTDYIIN